MMDIKVHPIQMSENSSRHILEMGGRSPCKESSIFQTILSVLALFISIATLCLLAIFFNQFQSLNLPGITNRQPYVPLEWLTPEQIDTYDTFLFDVDGTLKNANGYVPGSKEFIRQLNQKNKTVIIVSNSDWSTPEERAKSMDVGLSPSSIVIPLVVLQAYEASMLKGKRVLALAPPPVIQWLKSNGATLLNNEWNHTRGQTPDANAILSLINEKPEVVLIDSWSDYDMEAIDRIANILAKPDVKFYILSTDASWRGEGNLIYSDGGSYYESIKLITGREATGFGKPSENLNRYLKETYRLKKAIFFGDNLNTDFITANGLKIDSCLMIGTGVHSEVDWRRYFEQNELNRKPTYKCSFVQLI